MGELRKAEEAYRRITIVGGGNIGARLASEIEKKYAVKLIELNQQRAKVLADRLDNTVVIQGNATDRELLLEENIEQCDAFCALTNDDEVNIMSSLMAKRLGVRQVITLITKPAYVDLVQGGEIDVAISPQQATTSSVLSHVRKADVARVHSLRRGAAEAMEAIAHGDASSSNVVGRKIQELKLPNGVTIGAVVRGEEVLIAHDDVIIATDDHVILFMVDKSKVAAVERLFQVSLNFV
jgi:trk system potassium uptake protein TrkA